MDRLNVGIIGTGWCGGIRAEASAKNGLVDELHIAEIREDRLKEVSELTNATSATTDYNELIKNDNIHAIMISTTPESLHYPMAKEALEAGKHVLLEKPIARTLSEADELIKIAANNKVQFTIGYSQRFRSKYAYVREKFQDGTLGEPVSVLITRNITTSLSKRIVGRTRLSPAAMEATHDLDYALWVLAPRKPVRVYSQQVEKVLIKNANSADCQFIMVTLDDGTVVTVGAGWVLPPSYPNYSSTKMEFIGSKGAIMVDDSHSDVTIMTGDRGIEYPMSSMPGEPVAHVNAGPMAEETNNFINAILFNKPVVVKPEEARVVMELYQAADLSAERGEPVNLPMNIDPLDKEQN
ncbi:MAG: oxidoreductase [Rhodobiaceae bacterium]|jgi:scyllo-inositol 2-dehydrogenase (NAD+)|nr:oxidoreductase [Rhodobiaceae bacterium]|tara:strand:+ start:37419 stop:38477 length:1059 start_codon:yes stop_codon:yes gene_type:complete